MKLLKVISIIALMICPAFSASPSWKWVTVADGQGKDWCQRLVVDHQGNSYVTGRFEKNITIGNHTLKSFGGTDIFMAKIAETGTPIWAIRAGGTSDDAAFDVVFDTKGDLYITGSFSDSARFGNTMLISQGASDIFIAKVTPLGKFLWARSAGGLKDDRGYALAVAFDGLVYITGSIRDTVQFDDTVQSVSGENDAFVLCYDTSGRIQWENLLGSSLQASGFDVAVDATNKAVVTGFFRGIIKTRTGSLSSQFGNNNDENSGCDGFVAKYDSIGNLEWIRRIGGNDYDEGRTIAIGTDGSIYVSGNFQGNTDFGGSIVSCGETTYFCDNDSIAFVPQASSRVISSFSKSGRKCSCGRYDKLLKTKTTKDIVCKDTIIVSHGKTDIFFACYDSSGVFLWVKTFGSPGKDEVWHCSVDNSKNITLAGCFSDSLVINKTILKSRGVWDAFIAKMNPEGSCLWTIQAGGPSGNDGISGLSSDAAGHLYVCGGFSGSAYFGTMKRNGRGGESAFAGNLQIK